MNPEPFSELKKKHYNATVARLHFVHSDLMILRVKPDFPRPLHKPGQYSTLGLGYWEPRVPGCQEEIIKPGDETKLIRRAYSLGSSILNDQNKLIDLNHTDYVEFYIVLVRESAKGPPALTPRLFNLKEGDRLFIGEKITGHFTLDPVKPGDNVIFLATGTGEAPHNYMLWELLRRGHTGRILSACCVRYKLDLGYLAVHEELMRRYPHYSYLSLTTREANNVQNKVYIQDLITSGQLEEKLGRTLDPAKTHVYLCGNPKMIGVPTTDKTTGQPIYPQPTGVIEILHARNFQIDQPSVKLKGNIHFEEYW
jgi:ferredoxin--NADP+ reductase